MSIAWFLKIYNSKIISDTVFNMTCSWCVNPQCQHPAQRLAPAPAQPAPSACAQPAHSASGNIVLWLADQHKTDPLLVYSAQPGQPNVRPAPRAAFIDTCNTHRHWRFKATAIAPCTTAAQSQNFTFSIIQFKQVNMLHQISMFHINFLFLFRSTY